MKIKMLTIEKDFYKKENMLIYFFKNKFQLNFKLYTIKNKLIFTLQFFIKSIYILQNVFKNDSLAKLHF